MSARDVGQREGERNTAIEERGRAFPVHAKLRRDPPILFRPPALAVRGCPVVADLLGDRQVLRRLVPESTQRRQSGWSARELVLPNEWHRELDTPRTWVRRVAEK